MIRNYTHNAPRNVRQTSIKSFVLSEKESYEHERAHCRCFTAWLCLA